MEYPKVSAIITTFNRFDYFLNALNSVLSQNYQNLEIIVINDESDDDMEKEDSEDEEEQDSEDESEESESDEEEDSEGEDDDEIDIGSHIGLTFEDEEVFGVIVEFDDDEETVTIEEDGTGDLVTGYQEDMFVE